MKQQRFQHDNKIFFSWAANQHIRMIEDHVTLKTEIMAAEKSALLSQE